MMVSGRVLQVVKFFGVFLRHLIGCYLSVIMLSGPVVKIGGFRSRSKVLGNTCRVGNVCPHTECLFNNPLWNYLIEVCPGEEEMYLYTEQSWGLCGLTCITIFLAPTAS